MSGFPERTVWRTFINGVTYFVLIAGLWAIGVLLSAVSW